MMRLNRYVLAFCAVLVAFMLIVAGYYKVMFDIQRKRSEAAVAETAATRRALDAANAYTQQTIVIREKGDDATVRIREAPGADAPVPPDVLSAWRAGIDGLRNHDSGNAGSSSVP